MTGRLLLAACALLLAASAAHGQTVVLPPGTEIARPACEDVAEEHQGACGDEQTLREVRFAVTRSAIDAANACASTERWMDAHVERIVRDAVAAVPPPPRRYEPEWRVAARWIGAGLAVGGAFVAGFKLGSVGR